MRKLDANQLEITKHAKGRFIERYRKINPESQKTDEDLYRTMLSYINKATLNHNWEMLSRPDLYKARQYQYAAYYVYGGWVFVIGEDGDKQRTLVTCKRKNEEQN